ncbi:MAG: hypothetical protein L3J84_13110 [Gammaproteobacteria bacterium]|nr:hypothetical protein [Gammaproteobacteria bacterium]
MFSLLLTISVNTQADDNQEQLLKRINGLETTTVLSDPETQVKQIEVFVDIKGIEHDTQVPGSKRRITYQRERVYRSQTINEAMEDAANQNVQFDVDAAIIIQNAQQHRGKNKTADGNFYQLASTDLYFTAGRCNTPCFLLTYTHMRLRIRFKPHPIFLKDKVYL